MLTIPSPRPANHPISPFEGGWGDVNRQTVTSPPSKEVRELAQRSMCKGGAVKFTNRHVSPFEGSPLAGAAEYVQGGDVTNRQIAKSSNRQIVKFPNLLINSNRIFFAFFSAS